jgi:hypothetical protein
LVKLTSDHNSRLTFFMHYPKLETLVSTYDGVTQILEGYDHLKELKVTHCPLKKLAENLGGSLQRLDVMGTEIDHLPEGLVNVVFANVMNCRSLKQLPATFPRPETGISILITGSGLDKTRGAPEITYKW